MCAQSDQSLRCPHEETLGPQLPIECTAKTDQTGWIPRLICPCWAHMPFVGFVMRRLILVLLARFDSDELHCDSSYYDLIIKVLQPTDSSKFLFDFKESLLPLSCLMTKPTK